MSHLENLKKSLTALTLKNPLLVKNLTQIDQQKNELNFSFENTQKGELNLLYNTSPPFYLHDPKGALQAETPWIHSLSPQKKAVFILGAGLGYSSILLKKWLGENSSHTLVYVEPHLGVLFHLFQTEIGLKMAESPQIQFYTYGDKNELDYLLHYLAAYFSHYTIEVTALPSYQKAYPDLSAYFQSKLTHFQGLVTTRIMESKASFKYAMSNALGKMPHLSGNIHASKLQSHFDQVPCLIVGAGPSLKKNQAVLKTLRQKALILAGSSAILASNQLHLEPHFGTYLDPYARLHERLMSTTTFEMPSFHCARTYLQTSKSIHGPKLYLKGSDEFPYVNWLESELGFKGPLTKEFISVTTFNTSIALLLGCNPIIYVGVDLAYTDNLSYSHEDEKKQEEDSTHVHYNKSVWSKDIFGEPILTKEGWKIESHFLSEMIQLHPHREFINATEGGLGFLGAKNLSLQEVKEKYLVQSYPLDEWIHSDSLAYVVDDPKIPQKSKQLLKELKASFLRVQKVYKRVLKELKILEKKNQKKELVELDESFVQKAQVDLSNEIAYQYLLTHQHQIIDTENLKSHSLFYLLPPNAPKQLTFRVQLQRLTFRFTSYLKVSEHLYPLLELAIMEV